MSDRFACGRQKHGILCNPRILDTRFGQEYNGNNLAKE